MIALLGLVAGVAVAGVATAAQPAPTSEAVIAHARELSVHSIDGTLASTQSLDRWLRERARGGAVAWEANDCGEQTGNPATTPEDFPVCAEASFVNCAGEKSDIAIAVGTARGGIGRGTAAVFWATTGKASAPTLAKFAARNPVCEAGR